MRFACTGHQNLDETTQARVAAEIAATLSTHASGPLIGTCNLAGGADQSFALIVIAAGGQLEAVIPSENYETSFQNDKALATYRCLRQLASRVEVLPFNEPGEAAYLAAGKKAVDSCDVLLAVWDGHDAAGKGGTGDIVSYARATGKTVAVIWPSGSSRKSS